MQPSGPFYLSTDINQFTSEDIKEIKSETKVIKDIIKICAKHGSYEFFEKITAGVNLKIEHLKGFYTFATNGAKYYNESANIITEILREYTTASSRQGITKLQEKLAHTTDNAEKSKISGIIESAQKDTELLIANRAKILESLLKTPGGKEIMETEGNLLIRVKEPIMAEMLMEKFYTSLTQEEKGHILVSNVIGHERSISPLEMVKFFFSKGFDLNAKDKEGTMLIRICVLDNTIDTLKFLLEHGVTIPEKCEGKPFLEFLNPKLRRDKSER